ncbi:hypothetical protein [Desulfobaculum sp.]
MTRQDFASFLKGLCSYYGRTMDLADETTAAQVGLWFRVVQELPAEPLDWIALRIQQDCDFFPRNLPKTVRTYWALWLKEHPERKTSRTENSGAPCAECIGGVIYVQRLHLGRDGRHVPYLGPDGREHDRILTAAFGCARCCRGPAGMPLATVNQLLDAGWELQDTMPQMRQNRAVRTPETEGWVPRGLEGGE